MFKLMLDGIDYPKGFDAPSVSNIYLFQKFRVYNQVGLHEYGGMFCNIDNPNEYSIVTENSTNMYTRKLQTKDDKLVSVINNYNDAGLYLETHEPTEFYGLITGSYVEPIDLSKFDKCKDIKGWLARTTSTQNYNTTLYFNVESSKQLDEIAKYYKLKSPGNSILNSIIDNNRFAIRYKSFKLGGEYLSLVPASITFDSLGNAIDMHLYITTRQEDEYLLEPTIDTEYNRAIVINKNELVLNKPCYDRSLYSYHLVPKFPTFRAEKYYDGIMYESSTFNEKIASMSPNDPIHSRQLQALTSKDIFLLDSGIKLFKLLYEKGNVDIINKENFDIATELVSEIVGHDIEPDYFATYVDDSLLLYEPSQHKVQLYFKCTDLSKFDLEDVLNKDSNLISVVVDTISKVVVQSMLHYTYNMLRKV